MSLAFIIFISVIAISFILACFNFFTNTIQKKNENLCMRLSKEGTANNLIFCSQEILRDKVIGIDGIHRKIMVVEKIARRYDCSIISLDEVQNCELVAHSDSRTVNAEVPGIENNPGKILLQFEFKNYAKPVYITFYDSAINSKKELELLKAKAVYWEIMFSKMMTKLVRVRA